MDFKEQTERLRQVMHQTADEVVDTILEKGEALSKKEIEEILKKNISSYLDEVVLDMFGLKKEIDLWEVLVFHNRHDLISLLHQAEQGSLAGKKVMFYSRETPKGIMGLLKEFLNKNHVIVEVK